MQAPTNSLIRSAYWDQRRLDQFHLPADWRDAAANGIGHEVQAHHLPHGWTAISEIHATHDEADAHLAGMSDDLEELRVYEALTVN